MRNIGPMELLVILAVFVLLFGGKKIPEVAKGLGEGIKNFKNALKSDEKTEEKKQAERRSAKELKTSEKLAAELEKLSITIKMKVGEDEKLFGSVTSQMVADAVKEKGFDLDKRIFELAEPIKALGIYNVDVKLHQNVTGKVKVWVVRE